MFAPFTRYGLVTRPRCSSRPQAVGLNGTELGRCDRGGEGAERAVG